VNGFEHEPVLAEAVAAILRPAPGRLLLDGTLGGGGHAERLLLEGARVIGLDKDPRAIAAASARLARFGEAFRALRADFRDAGAVLESLGIAGVDGALVDLGVSSPQLDEPGRGFSFQRAGPLDMRMSGEGETLGALLERVDERELCRIRGSTARAFARPVARAAARRGARRRPARHRAARGRSRRRHPRRPGAGSTRPPAPSRRSIAVNDEFRRWPPGSVAARPPGPGGRAAAISFHSLRTGW
jgi:16S rRNA (cytosine1402-N4)-methyltransferase